MSVKIEAVERDDNGKAIKVIAIVNHIEIGFIKKDKVEEVYRMNFGGSSYIPPADWKVLIRRVYAIFYKK